MRFNCHIHRCRSCQGEWVCSNPDCQMDDQCGQCSHEEFEDWAFNRDPVGLAKMKETDESSEAF